MSSFGERLKAEREKKGYNQKEFAEIIDVTPTRLNYWEKDKREPDFFNIRKMIEVLGCDADYLIGTKLSSYEDNMNDFGDSKNLNTSNLEINMDTKSKTPFSNEAIEVAEAYDKAPFKDKNVARMALNLPLLETDVKEIKDSGNKGEQAG